VKNAERARSGKVQLAEQNRGSEGRGSAMLSEAERRKLSEIESYLGAEDPAFVQRFDDRARPQLKSGRRGRVALIVVTVATTVACVGLAVGSVGSVLVALIGFGVGAGLWVMHRLDL
jgi:hypothetical protein